MNQAMHRTSPAIWAVRIGGLLLLTYTLVMTFGVPLGPGIEDVTVQRTALTDEGASFAV